MIALIADFGFLHCLCGGMISVGGYIAFYPHKPGSYFDIFKL